MAAAAIDNPEKGPDLWSGPCGGRLARPMRKGPKKLGLNKLPHPLFVLFLALLGLAIGALYFALEAERAVLLGFDFAATVFAMASFAVMRRAAPEHLRAAAARNDAGRGLLLLVAAISLLVVLIVVGVELRRPKQNEAAQLALVASTLAIAWLFGNLVYALHYAHMFYDRGEGGADHAGLNFPATERPVFADFCYFAFVLGMTFQVSDVQITSSRIRHVATLHALLAFFFNIGAFALTVNVVAGGM